MEIYLAIVGAIHNYLHEEDYVALFLNGGCYWFASLVAELVPNSYLMINHSREHCAVVVEQKLYDITGQISKKGYQYAEEKDINYMRKHYRMQRNLDTLSVYIHTTVEYMLNERNNHLYENLNCND